MPGTAPGIPIPLTAKRPWWPSWVPHEIEAVPACSAVLSIPPGRCGATTELIAERGIGQLSLAAIGQRAGADHALVNHNFGTKAALIEQLNDTVDELYRRRIPAALEHKEGVDAVVAFAETYLGLATSSHPIALVVCPAMGTSRRRRIRPSRLAHPVGPALPSRLVERDCSRDRQAKGRSYSKTTAFVIVGLLRGVAMQRSY